MTRSLAAAAAVAFLMATGVASVGPAAAQDAGQSREQRGERGVKRFEKLDRNNDGAVDVHEVERRLLKGFERADRNNDGVVDQDEVKALGEKRGGKGKGGGKGGNRAEKRFQKADADRDGRVTKDEYLDKLPAWFRRADENKDDRVTRQEFDDFQANRKMKKRGGKRNRDEM